MPITFETILLSAGIQPGEVRLVRHKDSRAARGRTPYEMWRDDREIFERYQSIQNVRSAAKLKAPLWASFVGTPAGDTLFVGLYAVKGMRLSDTDLPMLQTDGIDAAGSCHIYDLALDNRLTDFIGKLVIEWGAGGRAWIQRADKQNKLVTELRKQFKEPDFPGFLQFVEPLSRLNVLPGAWKSMLQHSRGVYLLTCPRTKEQYVGSATGADGFWGRWQEYLANGHGGNVVLKSRDPTDYRVSILEVAGTAAAEQDILRIETQWKQKLQSREMGLNGN